MMKFFRVMLFVLIGLGALSLGFYFGLLQSSSADAGTPESASPASQENFAITHTAEKPQVNLLLVTLGSRQAGNLKSAWLVSLHTANPHRVNFVPLYPNESAGSEQFNALLEGQFALSAGGEIAAPFLDTLQAMYMVEWDATITLDRAEISQAVNYLGGTLQGDQIIDGEQVLALIDQGQENGNSGLQTGADLINGTCNQLTHTISNEQLSTLADFLAAHTTILPNQKTVSADLLRGLVFDPKLSCAFPTLSDR